jgi:hypothetical protein
MLGIEWRSAPETLFDVFRFGEDDPQFVCAYAWSMGLLNRTLVRDSPLISMSQSRGSSKRLRSLLVSRHNSSGRFRGELKNLEGEGRVTRTGILERAHQNCMDGELCSLSTSDSGNQRLET